MAANRRLSKHQMVKHGFEFDIYTERQSSLIVPYDAVAAHPVAYDGIRVASLEHLLVLKLEAFADRKGSAKGDKDAKDLVRIGAVARRRATGFRAALAAPYIRDVHVDLLASVERGPQVTALALGNAMMAKRLRREFAALRKAYAGPPARRHRRQRPNRSSARALALAASTARSRGGAVVTSECTNRCAT